MESLGDIIDAAIPENFDAELFARLVTLRRWFHQHPELAFEEAETARRIITELERLKIPFDYAGVGHAVIGHIAGNAPYGNAYRAGCAAAKRKGHSGAPF